MLSLRMLRQILFTSSGCQVVLLGSTFLAIQVRVGQGAHHAGAVPMWARSGAASMSCRCDAARHGHCDCLHVDKPTRPGPRGTCQRPGVVACMRCVSSTSCIWSLFPISTLFSWSICRYSEPLLVKIPQVLDQLRENHCKVLTRKYSSWFFFLSSYDPDVPGQVLGGRSPALTAATLFATTWPQLAPPNIKDAEEVLHPPSGQLQSESPQ